MLVVSINFIDVSLLAIVHVDVITYRNTDIHFQLYAIVQGSGKNVD